MRTAGGIRCSTKRADVMRPSQPSFWIPGSPARNLSVTSLPRPALRNCAPGIASVSLRSTVLPSVPYHVRSNVATGASWILPRLWSRRVTSSQRASGVTIRHDTRLSSAVPHSTAFLPPAFIATLPPMHDASADVGSTAKTSPAASAASITRRVTTPAPASIVGTGPAHPGSAMRSTAERRSSFSVLMTAERASSGIAPPVYPVPPPRGMIVRPSSMQPCTSARTSSSVSGWSTTNGYSTRQSVASVTCATRARPSKAMLSFAVCRASVRTTFRRNTAVSANAAAKRSTAARAASMSRATLAPRSSSPSSLVTAPLIACAASWLTRRLSISESR